MRKIRLHILTFSLLILPLAIHAQDTAPPNALRGVVNSAEAIPQALPEPETPAAEKTPEEVAETATLIMRVSQLMMVRLDGASSPSSGDRQLLQQVPVGGVVLPQLLAPEALSSYASLLRVRTNPNIQPMMVGIDLIGSARAERTGAAHGLRVPVMLTTAAAGPSEVTAALYQAQAADLATMGIDFHFGPILGLAAPLTEDVRLSDSFGSLPDATAMLATQIGHALESHNLAWAPAGFPGGVPHASGRAPAVVLTPRSALRNVDLKPYEAAIAAGADMIHVGTTLVPSLDPERPACLSPAVIRDALRDALDFDGLVIAGPMDSPDISRVSDTSTAAVEALISGADMIYWNGSGPRVARAIVDIVAAVERDIIPESIINAAFARIVEFKKARKLAEWPAPDVSEVRKVVKETGKRPEPVVIEKRAITLLRNRDQILPLKKEVSEPIGVTGAYGVSELREALQEYFKHVGAQGIRTARHATRIQDFEIDRLTGESVPVKTAIVVLASDIELASQLRLIRGLKQNGRKVVVVLLGEPKNLAAYDEADALILGYGNAALPQDTMTALADVLVGEAPAEVLPPLRDIELRAGEAATFDVHDVVRTPTGRLPVSLGEPYVAGYAVSYRSDAIAESVRWEFGDGKRSTQPVASHTYKKPGTYTITLRVGKKYPTTGTFRVIVK